MATFKHVLVATDFEASSERALVLALELAGDSGSQLTVLHACEVPSYAYTELSFAAADLLEPIAEIARAKLDELLERVRRSCPRAQAILKTGVPWQQVLATAAEVGADLIVLGTHGRRGMAHALLGSVAEKVVRLSAIPVLIARAPKS